VAIGDSATGEVVRGELDLHLVARKDADVVLPHLPRDRREDAVPAVDLHPKHRAGQSLDDLAFDLDLLLFLSHPPHRNRVRRTRSVNSKRTHGERRAGGHGSKEVSPPATAPRAAATLGSVRILGPSSVIAT